MATRWRVITGCALALICSVPGTGRGGAQSPSAALREMTQMAGVIFTGQVVGVRPLAGIDGSTGVVEISFAVEEAVRGVSEGVYTMRTWAGLWPAGDMPFIVGQRYLMLLHAPSAAGLSSPVGGMDGAIPIRGGLMPATETNSAQTASGGAETTSAQTTTAGNSAVVDGRVVDLRWVGTRAVQPVVYRSDTASAHAQIDSSSVATATAGASLQGTAYATVMGMLHGWEKAAHAAR